MLAFINLIFFILYINNSFKYYPWNEQWESVWAIKRVKIKKLPLKDWIYWVSAIIRPVHDVTALLAEKVRVNRVQIWKAQPVGIKHKVCSRGCKMNNYCRPKTYQDYRGTSMAYLRRMGGQKDRHQVRRLTDFFKTRHHKKQRSSVWAHRS